MMMVMRVDCHQDEFLQLKCNLMQTARSESETSDGGETDDEGIRSQLRLASSIIRKEESMRVERKKRRTELVVGE